VGTAFSRPRDGEHRIRNKQLINKYTIVKITIISTFSALALLASSGLSAGESRTEEPDGTHGERHGKTPVTGKAGEATSANRTVNIAMYDNYYDMENLSVKRGETIRFVITNKGELVHEFNIGTSAMHAAHKKEMAMMMEHGALEPDKINHDKMKMDMGGGKTMRHDDANSVLLEPGQTAEIVWKFPVVDRVKLEFACNVPGHYESGMVGKIRFLNHVS
jgi:uncharacterized cupredoxin-like copper-binding protein